MRVKLLLNIGYGDARRLELDASEEGEIVNVKDEAGKELVARGWAVSLEAPAAKTSPKATKE